MRATRVARRPRVCPEASMTYHLRAISPLGKYVDIRTLPEFDSSRRTAELQPRHKNKRGHSGRTIAGQRNHKHSLGPSGSQRSSYGAYLNCVEVMAKPTCSKGMPSGIG